jgi:hypothetical protein
MYTTTDMSLRSVRNLRALGCQSRQPLPVLGRGPNTKLDPAPPAGITVDAFLTPIDDTFTAFVGPRHFVVGGGGHAARPITGKGLQKQRLAW